MAQVSPARKAAFFILLAVDRGERHSDDLLRAQSLSKLSAVDRNLATALVLGVLRWQIALDAAVRPLLKKPNARLDVEVLIALRLGAFQLLQMDRIPARAAIDESVELVKQAGHRFASGMVNAVLRKLAAGGKKTADATSAYPQWMVERWTQTFGEDTACEVCRLGQAQPVIGVRVADAPVEQELATAGVELVPGSLLSRARIVLAGDITTTSAFREGRTRVQDEGSQLIGEIAGTGTAILDCCAAPGGKTLVLAERNPEARIVACEVSEPRLHALRERLSPLGGRIECRLADATHLPFEAEFDLVLADVPCTGTGTLGRNPEIRHRLVEGDFARQAERQKEILASALRAVLPAGRVAYSTCSLEPEENEQVIAAVLGATASARLTPMQARLEEMEREGILISGAAAKLNQCVTPAGYLRLRPGQFGTDGFFVALIEKM
ncbi:transcription antitermination factor NusB [Occallatibacter riparius]|uniref:Methyltransferase domain-containing protein n=1 Tax=Occallatibacter riparius TaxID=1002689 RepID=A0A9J7BYR9_9BACT|nr:transcription antitermination factor NusB [Occallatibacter riparius]UWZ86709.1 methyltransferase domain-containing protein [Occallatibacter riparius]